MKNFITQTMEIQYESKSRMLLVSERGDLFISDLRDEKMELDRIQIKSFKQRINYIANKGNGIVAFSSKSGHVGIFELDHTFNNTMQEIEMKLVSSFTIDNKKSFDYNWVKMEFDPDKGSKELYLIANNYNILLVYNFHSHQTVTTITFCSLPKTLGIFKDSISVGLDNGELDLVSRKDMS